MNDRPAFLTAPALLRSARLAAAQDKKDAQRTYRIGVLASIAEPANQANMEQLRKGLKDLGYVEGKNLRIEYRTSEARNDRFAGLADELVRLQPDLIIANGTPAALAAKSAGGTVPVVAAAALDPVETGLVASLEKPGGMVTGIAVVTQDLEKTRVELLRALAPGRKKLAVFVNMTNPGLASTWPMIEAGAKAVGLEPELIEVPSPKKVPRAFEAAVAKKAEALVVRPGALPEADRRALVGLAAKHKLPAIYSQRQYVDVGGLVSYGLSTPDMYYRAATFVDKILKGGRPSDLPMESPSKYEFVVNRRTLRALDLVIPPDLLLRSNEIVG